MVDNGLPGKENTRCIVGVTGSSVKGILIVLLALGVCFSYFYFFTDIFRPNEEAPNQTDVSIAEVKKPLPERAVQTVVSSATKTVQVAPVSPVPSVQAPVAPAVNGRKQAQSPPGKPVAPSSDTSSSTPAKSGTASSKPTPSAMKPATAHVEPAPLPSKQKETARKVAASESRKVSPGKASQPAASAQSATKAVTGKPASKETGTSLPQKKNTAGEPKPTGSPHAKQKIASAKQGAVKEGKVSEGAGTTVSVKEGQGFTLVVGTYVMPSTLKADKAKLERAGVHPTVSVGPKKNQPMNRLVVAEYDSYTTARAELDRVKKASKDAFLLQENGRVTIYAGSYYRHDRAVEEQERLRAQGFAPILKKAVAPVGSSKLTVGGFPTREAAQGEAARLRKLGFKPFLVQSGTK
jgi:hypothetical protein